MKLFILVMYIFKTSSSVSLWIQNTKYSSFGGIGMTGLDDAWFASCLAGIIPDVAL